MKTSITGVLCLTVLSVGKPKVVEMSYTGANSTQHPKKGHTNRLYC